MTAEPWDRRLAGLETTSLDGGLTLHVARSYRERRRGLAKMTPLPDDHALRILRTNSVHTFGMRFPLDLVWLGRRGQVLRVDSDVPDEDVHSRPVGDRDARGSRRPFRPRPRPVVGGYTGPR